MPVPVLPSTTVSFSRSSLAAVVMPPAPRCQRSTAPPVDLQVLERHLGARNDEHLAVAVRVQNSVGEPSGRPPDQSARFFTILKLSTQTNLTAITSFFVAARITA